MAKIAIIPARLGSKRIPEKNIKLFHGNPIISYSIQAAIKSQIFDEVMVSTDSTKIGELAKNFGASVPFYRSPENSDDYSGLAEVLIEVLENYSVEFQTVCCLLPTAAFITPEKLVEADRMLSEENTDAVISVQEFSYPIGRALHLDGNKVSMIEPENYSKRSQDFRPAYHDAGQFYFIKTNILKSEQILFPKNCAAMKLNEFQAHDIDTLDDWNLAEMKFKQLKGL